MEEIIEKIISYGKRFGDVEVIYNTKKIKSLTYRNKKYHSSDASEVESLSIRITNGKRFGVASGSVDNWKKEVENAVKAMKINTKLKHEIGKPKKKKFVNNTYSEKINSMNIREIEEILKTIQSEKYQNVESKVSKSYSELIYANNETIKKDRKTSISASVIIKNKDAQVEESIIDYKPFDYTKVLQKAEADAEKFANKKKFKTKIVDAVFLPTAGEELIRSFLTAFRGDLIYKKKSYLYDKYKKKVFSDNLNILSAPNKKVFGGYSFDGEGNPASEKYLVKSGKLNCFLLNRYIATALGIKNPFHASSFLPTGTLPFGHFEIEKGKSKVDGELIIKDSMGWHTVDPISGNVSVSLINATMEGIPVKEGMIAFNIFDAMKHVELGRKLERVGSIKLPKLKFKVQFIG